VNMLQKLASRHWRDYRARQPGTCFADPGFVLFLDELQDIVAQLRVAAGDRLIGYKVGCIGPGTVQPLGLYAVHRSNEVVVSSIVQSGFLYSVV
jgi:hypothetical protein